MNASFAPILERKWVRLSLLALAGLALAMTLNLASSRSASAQTLCFDPNTGTYYDCSAEVAAALQASLDAVNAQQAAALQTTLDAIAAQQGSFTIGGGDFLASPGLTENPTFGAIPFPTNVPVAQPITGQVASQPPLLLGPSFTPYTTPRLTYRLPEINGSQF